MSPTIRNKIRSPLAVVALVGILVIAVIIVAVTLRQRDRRSAAAEVHETLCQAADDARRDNVPGASDAFASVHDGLHVLARDVQARHRDVAARLLEAKSVVERELQAPTAQLPVALSRLADATRQAVAATGEKPPAPCPT